ncbi:MAG TPA: pectin acetylesterase-family hydrolase [Kofleriaceae bacterium]|nr:pectin acetylesterase-family hydrolase [Kofleriaceae bacterium]
MRSLFPTLLFLAASACTSSSMMDDTGDDGPATCGNNAVDTGEQCDDGNDNNFDGCRSDCTAVDKLTSDAMTWKYFEIPGTKCIDGTPAGFSVNFNPASTKIAIYLEGGGACFNTFCDSLFTRGGNQPSNGGIFDRTNAANPLKDWTWVYVPYCSGDVYSGQADTMVGGKMRSFYGYSNITAFLERIVPSFTVDQVLLTGASAGGFGAAVNFTQTQRAYGSIPVTLIDDSGPPMSKDIYPPCLQTLWKTTWGLDKTVVAECGSACSGGTFVEETFDHMRQEFPDMKGGLFSSVGDQTIRTFAGYGWSGGYNMCKDTPTAVTTTVYTQGLMALRTKVQGEGASFGTYYISGSSHTIERSANFYSMSVANTPVTKWMSDLLAGTPSHLGPN